jgi:hypothetical protein
MSEESKNPPAEGAAPSSADEIKNLKAEMNRKLDNTNAQLLAAIEALKPKAKEEPRAKVSVLDDEDAFANNIVEQAVSAVTRVTAEQQRTQAKISQLYNDYPELNDPENAFSRKADEYYRQLSDADKKNPTALEAAVYRAAVETGTKPKKQRSTEDDNFSLGGAPSGNRGASKKTTDAISDDMVEIGALMGVDYKNDEKRKAALKKVAGRKDWNRYK